MSEAKGAPGRLFDPIDLHGRLNAGRDVPGGRWPAAFASALAQLPAGAQSYWGVPFALGGSGEPCWLLLGPGDGLETAVTVPLSGETSPSYLIFLHVSGLTLEEQSAEALPPSLSRAGQPLAAYVLVYEDGEEHRQAVRWRFEINGAGPPWGQKAFAARSHVRDSARDFRGPYERNAWGYRQTSVEQSSGAYWLFALANPHPQRRLRAVRLESEGVAAVALAAITAFSGRDHPLRHHRLQSFKVTLPEAAADVAEVDARVDLGIIARKYAVPAFDPQPWLDGEGISRPLPDGPGATGSPAAVEEVLLDVSASADATLTVSGHEVPLRPAYEAGAARSADGAVRVEVLSPRNTWVHVTVEDGAGGAVPSRVHFRAADGRYLPPYGFRQEVNDNWFEDYGNDLKLHGTQYAYVDGAFQAELPVGAVYAEVFKGFEHRPLRRRLTIAPGQRALRLALERPLDWRARGWMTADTHVHFLSPQTAWLQGQAEGLNLVNLLASQWGDLFTNVGDLSGGLSGVSRGDTLVWVGTENRQHLLGHLSLLGVRGAPVFPLTTAGPSESYLGDPTRTTLAEWADEARRKDGLAVIPLFPNHSCEVAADIVQGKIDAVEINMQAWPIHVYEWYRYLNCGYRVTAVGGTDKMSAQMPVGAVRTYARLAPGEPLTFDAWGAAVRAGRTFTTTGPLVELSVEGKGPGDELPLPAGGGTVHVRALAESVVPFSALEIVVNGRVVTERRSAGGTYRCELDEALRVPGSAWIAARVTGEMRGWVGSPRIVAAHTTPVYAVAGGEALFTPSDGAYLLTLVEAGLTWMDTLATRPDPERHARNRRVFEDARDRLHARLHAHGEGHTHPGGGHPP